MSVLVKLTTPSSNWHEGAMTIEVEAKNIKQAFELKSKWADLCSELDKKDDNVRTPYRGGTSGGPTPKQRQFLINLAKDIGIPNEDAMGFVYKTATEVGVKSLKTADQAGIDRVITALKEKRDNKSKSSAPLFDEAEAKELAEDDPFE